MAKYKPLLLTVDDDPSLLELISFQVDKWGFASETATNASDLFKRLQHCLPNAILLDLQLGADNGEVVLQELRDRYPDIPVIMITSSSSVSSAVDCIKHGAFDYVVKPLDFDRLRIEVSKAIEKNRLSLRVRDLEADGERFSFHGMIGGSPAIQEIYRTIDCVASTDVSVLILGETGTGKEVSAHAIHAASKRNAGPFVPVNCAAIPQELIESALFGHVKGAFTGASSAHEGYCQQAHRGTLFLDEIAEMDVGLQAKLLRFLQDHIAQPVGAKSGSEIDVRIVAATNRDPLTEIKNQRLREDLFYRLNVVTLNLPPLRERPGDIAVLSHHFLDQIAIKYELQMREISEEAMRQMELYDWPGNVRELENTIERIAVTNRNEQMLVEMLPDAIRESKQRSAFEPSFGLGTASGGNFPTLEEMERRLILEALLVCDWNVPKAAERLGSSEATVYRKIKKFALVKPVA
ncbi:MAG: sigma-54-dependent transcriptional regulator [Phycisphaerae bacterium]